jgi:TRIAD3 protein (E3 ubiquitin-protein ligase RNF216)
MPMAYIDASLSQSGHRLFSAYQLLDEANRTYDPLTSGFQKIKNPRKQHTDFREESIEIILNDPASDLERTEVLRELRAARRAKAKAEARRQAERVAQLEEEANEAKAQAEGTMSECGCCFGDYPLNRMVHCDAEPMHWFCRACALRNAENEVGQSKYELCCMSMDGCNARFTIAQR